MKKFENGMTCEKFVDDGNYSIGYVDGIPAQWDGNAELTENEEFRSASEDDTFGVNCQDEFILTNGKWVENVEEKSTFILSPTHIYDEKGHRLCTCGSGEPWETCSGTESFGSDYCG